MAVKVARENHDMRFDVPCVGPQTLETCAAAQLAVLALESGRSLVLEQDIVEQLAARKKISLVTVGASLPQE